MVDAWPYHAGAVGSLIGKIEIEGAGDADFNTYIEENADYAKHRVAEVPGRV